VAGASGQAGEHPIVGPVTTWFDEHERPLPWRSSTPWGVLVSEFMLQQTPVDRVLPLWPVWMTTWPTADDLAAAPLADVLRAWGRLGYPRRARRLHDTANVIIAEHAGEVPTEREALLALPGVGDYTAAAILAFAHSRRSIVLDTNVRRVLARALDGAALPPGHVTVAERRRAEALWPASDGRSARWSAAVMELGAVVCTARRPNCQACPLVDGCAWVRAGRPAPPPRRSQPEYAGSDRQARGEVMRLLRDADGPLTASAIERCWPDAEQAERALQSLVDDGLVAALPRRRYALPH
jgi:A/G-specific adenine glycosylase